MLLSQFFSLFFTIFVVIMITNNVNTYMLILKAPVIGLGLGGTVNEIIQSTDKCSIGERKFFGGSWDLSLSVCELDPLNNTIYLAPSLILFHDCNYTLDIPDRLLGLTYFKDLKTDYDNFIEINSWIIGLSIFSSLYAGLLLILHYYKKDSYYHILFSIIHIFLAIIIFIILLYNVNLANDIIEDISVYSPMPEILIKKNQIMSIVLCVVIIMQLIMTVFSMFDKEMILKINICRRLYNRYHNRGYDTIGFD